MNTKTINPFNKERRKIKCIANKHDYLGNGEMFIEPDLVVGEIYTLVSVSQESYGTMVFLKEVNSKMGYQSYLFEEIVPHDEELFKRNYELWLEKVLSEADGFSSSRPLDLPKLFIEKKFSPEFTEEHNYGNAYWIVPVEIKDKDRIGISDFKELSEHEISIDAEYFDLLLLDFFKNNLNSELDINKHRISTDYNPDGDYIKGFAWHLNPNFYTQKDLTQIFTELSFFKNDLKQGNLSELSEKTKRILKEKMKWCISNEGISEEEFVHKIIVFYEKLIVKLLEMFNYSNIICVFGP